MSELYTHYLALDAALVSAGFPPTSPWWLAELRRFLGSGRRRWVLRVCRRGGKSSTLCRLAVVQALAGAWHVPPGDTAVVSFVSVDRDEASSRLRTIEDILDALRVRYERRGDTLALTERRLEFRVVTCSTRGTVGFTAVAVFGDEVARWESRDTAANPARDVLGSLRPTMATQPSAFEALSSSPWSTDDYHAELFEQGETEHQLTSFAPSWIANPTLTEELTRELEPDARVWSREYAAEPGSVLSSAFPLEDIAGCYHREPTGQRAYPFVAIDASALRQDGFAWVSGYTTTESEVVVERVDGWHGTEIRRTTVEECVRVIATEARRLRVREVYGDNFEAGSLPALFQRHGARLHTYAWSAPSKDAAARILSTLMRERKLYLPEHFELRRQLTQLRARLSPSGITTYATNGQDYAACLFTLGHAIGGRQLRLDTSKSKAYSNGVERARRLRQFLRRVYDPMLESGEEYSRRQDRAERGGW